MTDKQFFQSVCEFASTNPLQNFAARLFAQGMTEAEVMRLMYSNEMANIPEVIKNNVTLAVRDCERNQVIPHPKYTINRRKPYPKTPEDDIVEWDIKNGRKVAGHTATGKKIKLTDTR